MFLSYDKLIRYIYWIIFSSYMIYITYYYYGYDKLYVIINLLLCYIILIYYELISPFFHYYSGYNKFLYSECLSDEIRLEYDNILCEYKLYMINGLILYISHPISNNIRYVYKSDNIVICIKELDKFIYHDIGISLLYSGYLHAVKINIFIYSLLYIVINLAILTL